MAAAFYPPTSQKALRRFSSGETARIVGVSDSRLRQLSIEEQGPQPEVSNTGRRSYSLADIHALRHHLDDITRSSRTYLPGRTGNEHLQVISVVNFMGGSGKTTTAAHLAQYLLQRSVATRTWVTSADWKQKDRFVRLRSVLMVATSRPLLTKPSAVT